MNSYLLALHVLATALVVGSLFLQSLMAVMALRLPAEAHREGQRILQRRVHLFIYYPILLVALGTGLWLALLGDAFHQGRWLQWKLVLVVVLIGLGFLTGRAVIAKRLSKGPALVLHVLVFLTALWTIYLAVARPF
jgi:uncharacterized membrane protein